MTKKITPEQAKLISDLHNLVYKAWSTLPNGDIKHIYKEEVLLAGYKGLCKGVQHWDPEKYDLVGYCYHCIKSQMRSEIKYWIKLKQNDVISLDQPIKDSKDGNDVFLYEVIPDPNENVEEKGIMKAEADRLFDIMYEVCTKQEIEVIELYCFHYMNYLSISKIMRLSRQRINQIITSAREKILKKYENIDQNA